MTPREPRRRLIGGLTRRQFVLASAAIGAGLTSADALISSSGVLASVTQPQTPLPSANIPKYVTHLRTFAGRRVTGSSFNTKIVEFQQLVLPRSVYPQKFLNGTYLWGFGVDGTPPSWPGTSVEAVRGTPTNVTYINSLPGSASSSNLEPLLMIDQTLHWADPLNAGNSFKPFAGPIPTTVHLHGAMAPAPRSPAPSRISRARASGRPSCPGSAPPSSGSSWTPPPTPTPSTSTSSSSRSSTARAPTSPTS